MSKPDGGPAFPNKGDNTPAYPLYDGMTLRDYYAAHAPFTFSDAIRVCGFRDPIDFCDANRGTIIAVLALMGREYADAMLAERDK